MPDEIERKFLVDPARVPAEARRDGATYAQGYLAFVPSVRVRVATARDGGERAWLTIKGPGTIRRAEYEYEIPSADGRALLDLCVAALAKVRYRVPVGAHTWDLDEFTGPHAGLWLAEVELAAVDEPFERPAWIAAEVSDDSRYTNGALARAGRAPSRNGE
jgi:adenylate cyclase